MDLFQVTYTGTGTAPFNEFPLSPSGGSYFVISPLSESALLAQYQAIDPNAKVKQMPTPQFSIDPIKPDILDIINFATDRWADYDED